MTGMTEADWEAHALDVLGELGWQHLPGKDLAPGTEERLAWDDLVVPHRVLHAMRRLNPTVPGQYLQQALAAVLAPTSQDAITENQRVHSYLVDGFRGITYIDDDGQEQTPTIRLIGSDPGDNDWLASSQATVKDGEHHRRFDVVLYCNGLPLSIIELKKAGTQAADVTAAHGQLATYLREFGMAFRFCAFVIASDGVGAKYGTPFTPLNHFSPWNVDDDGNPVDLSQPDTAGEYTSGLETALYGLANQERFGQLLRSYIAFDEHDAGVSKRIAKPHQYFAVTKAVGATVQALESNGKAGVVWHTQGSGKSMEMELYTNQILRHPKLLNPTVVVITDRKELDGQLFEAFDHSLLLPEKPQQVTTRTALRTELSARITGGIYFTTLQKFGRSSHEREAGAEHPLLTSRRNVVVIVDEAHRSHYDDLDGYARHLRDALPHATLIAFTGTPISLTDRDTREVFGDYIDVYDLTRAVQDGATVPVYFEPRLIKVSLPDGVTQETLDAAADEATEGLDDAERAKLERDVAVVNAIYGAPERVKALAADVVTHWERRSGELVKYIEGPGKAMIVCSTRRICADLYAAIVAIRPDWHSDDLARGRIKVVYSGVPADPQPIARHVRRESGNKVVKNRLRDPDDELEIVIVKDMMLTGYDSPPLHTLYLDRPLRGALLMQTLARVNRTFRGKPDGLLVAHAPLADNLSAALAEYTRSDQETKPVGRDTAEVQALAVGLLTRLDELCADVGWRAILAKGKTASGKPAYLQAVHATVAHLRAPTTAGNQTPGNQTHGNQPPSNQTTGSQVADQEVTPAHEFRRLSGQVARAWALAGGARNLQAHQPTAAFYEEVRVWMAKFDAAEREADGNPVPEEIRRLLAAIIGSHVEAGEVLDIYAAAGMPKPPLDDLGPAYIEAALAAENPHLAIEALRALVAAESVKVTRHNAVRQRAFSDRIAELMALYTNQQLTSAEVIAELIAMAKEVADEGKRGQRFSPPLSTDELAFYDAVATNESAVRQQGDDVLAQIARDLVEVMRRDVRTDWTVREDVRAKLRSSIKRLLVKHGYPPDRQPAAIKLVMEQMEALAPRYADHRAATT